MGVTDKLKAQAMGLSQKAMERLFADEKRAAKVAEVIGAAQRGKAALNHTQRQIMNQLNFASRTDFKEIGKQLSVYLSGMFLDAKQENAQNLALIGKQPDNTPSPQGEVFSFGPFRLFPAARAFEKNGAPIALGDRALDILMALVGVSVPLCIGTLIGGVLGTTRSSVVSVVWMVIIEGINSSARCAAVSMKK